MFNDISVFRKASSLINFQYWMAILKVIEAHYGISTGFTEIEQTK